MTAPAAAEPKGEAAVVSEQDQQDSPAAASPDAAVGDKGQAPASPPAEAVEYALALPEKSPLDPKAVERVVEFAKANAIPPDAAQQVLDRMDAELAETLKVLDAASKPGGTLYETKVKQWNAEALTAFDLGNGDPNRLKAVVVDAELELKKAPPAIREFLIQSGYGSHPDAIRWLRDIHARTKEKPTVQPATGTPSAQGKSYGERLYGTMTKPGADAPTT